MNFNDIKSEVLILSQMVAEWCDSGGESTIEKDIILAKLRNLYEGVKFSETRASGLVAPSEFQESRTDNIDIKLPSDPITSILFDDNLSIESNASDASPIEELDGGITELEVVTTENRVIVEDTSVVATEIFVELLEEDTPEESEEIASDTIIEEIVLIERDSREALFRSIASHLKDV